MIDTKDLSSYYPGYDEYCEPVDDKDLDEDSMVDILVDEAMLEEESDRNGLY